MLQNIYFLFIPLESSASIRPEDKLDREKLMHTYQRTIYIKVDVDKKNDLLNKALLKHFKMNKVDIFF